MAGNTLPLKDLGERLGTIPGAFVHLGACSVLIRQEDGAAEFLRATRARAFSGYAKDVDWVDSAAFDQILFGCLSSYSRAGDAMRELKRRHTGLIEYLGWTLYDGGPASSRTTQRAGT